MSDLEKLVNAIALDLENRRVWQAPATLEYGSYTRTEDTRDILRRSLEPLVSASSGKWLIWSNEHGLWWAPNSRGYTRHRKDAGRYTFAEAAEICDYRNDSPDETMVPEMAPNPK